MFIYFIASFQINAQKTNTSEQYGKTFNLGLGVGGYSGYYSYVGHSIPVFNFNYEFAIAPSATLSPFISFYTYSNRYYWGVNNTYKYYKYRETVIPIGIKGYYYFDQILEAKSKWDFYLAGSLGFALVRSSWDSDYYGDEDHFQRGNSLFLDIHAGVEYHVNRKFGLYFDLSSGTSTIGISIH